MRLLGQQCKHDVIIEKVQAKVVWAADCHYVPVHWQMTMFTILLYIKVSLVSVKASGW